MAAKAIKTLILGCGARGRTYARYALAHPREFEIIATADPRERADFSDWSEALAAHGAEADLAIVALPDRLHFAAGMAALKAGCHLLMEKPIGCTAAECRKLVAAAERAKRAIFPGFVLRHTRQYRKVAQILAEGLIGEVLSIHHLNAVSYPKTVTAFCRGQWAKTAESGPMILTKSSHDLDLINWWCGGRKPKSIVSMGGQKLFKPENAPAGSADGCGACEVAECPFREEDAHCVYKCGADVVDHQSTLIEYEGGPLVNFELEAITARRGRFTRFFGTKGTLLVDEGKVTLRRFGKRERVFLFQPETENHGGGDDGLMADIRRALSSGAAPLELARETLLSHLLAFWAEDSRKALRICRP